MRVGIAECLGIKERQLRVVSPDVGGGFGSKNRYARRSHGLRRRSKNRTSYPMA